MRARGSGARRRLILRSYSKNNSAPPLAPARRNGEGGRNGKREEIVRRNWPSPLHVQVLIGVVAGVLLGWLAPDVATSPWIEFLGKAFVS